MSIFSAYTRKMLLNGLLGYAKPSKTKIYVGLSFEAGGRIVEPLNLDYNRVECPKWKISDRAVANQSTIAFYTRSDWGLISHFTLWDSLEGGNLLGQGILEHPLSAGDDKVLSFSKGKLSLSFLLPTLEDWAANMFINQIFSIIPMIPVTNLKLGLSYTDPKIKITRPDNPEYRDQEYMHWDVTTEGNLVNGTRLLFPTPRSDWGDISYVFIQDEKDRLLLSSSLTHLLKPNNFNPVVFEEGDICFIFD